MSSDEARAGAERRYAMEHGAGYSYPREAVVTMKRGAFEAGAAWQAERDALRIAELEAEVEQWRRVAVEQTRLERDRAEAAEAKLAAVRAVCVARTEEYPDGPYDFVRGFALVMLAVLVVLRDVMATGLGFALGLDEKTNSNWGYAGNWSYRHLNGRLEVKQYGPDGVEGAMTRAAIDDMLGDDLADVRAWAASLDDKLGGGYWGRSRPVEFERAHVAWNAERFWRDAEEPGYEARIAAWTRFDEVLTAHIERIERESGVAAPECRPRELVVCESCGTVSNGFINDINCGAVLRRLHGRPELLCCSLSVRIERASFWISGRRSVMHRQVDGEWVAEETRPTQVWDEFMLELADYGWTFAPDGTPIAPADWPRALADPPDAPITCRPQT